MVAFSDYIIRINPSVTVIPPSALCGVNVQEVELPEGLLEIGDDAFHGCTSLRKITLLQGLRSIGREAFRGCVSLVEVGIPSSVTDISDNAFCGCSSLVVVNLHEGLITIGRCAFGDCTSLLRIDIPSSVTDISARAFAGCSSLKMGNLHEGLRTIGEYAFQECTSLLRIDIPSSVTDISAGAFNCCSSLTEVNLREGLITIGECAFRNCTSLLRIDIPSSVADIGEQAFYDCSSLKMVNLREGLSTIGEYAFEGCTSLIRVNIPASVTEIGDGIFHYCMFVRNIAIDPSSNCGQGLFGRVFERFRDLYCTEDIKARFDGLPIHRFCFYHLQENGECHNPLEVLQELVDQRASHENSVDCLGMTPLHVLACSGSHDITLCDCLIASYPEAITVKDKWGETPLDYIILSEASDEVLQLCLASHAKYQGDVNPFDIDKAIQRCESEKYLKQLIKAQRTYFPELVVNWQSIADESAQRYVPLRLYQVLVQASISPCFIQMSVEYQLELDDLIAGIEDGDEGITPKQYDEIQMLITDYSSFLREATITLELAVWKVKYYEMFLEHYGNDHYQIRSDSRTKGGAVCAVMIPLVSSFL